MCVNGKRTLLFAIYFAVWMMFSTIDVKVKTDLGWNDMQFNILMATTNVFRGSLNRIFLRVWTDQNGGRLLVFILQILATSTVAFLIITATIYPMFLFVVLGIFGIKNVEVVATSFGVPVLLVVMGNEWERVAQEVYAVTVSITTILFYIFTENGPAFLQGGKNKELEHVSFIKQLELLKKTQGRGFSLFYFFVLGTFIGLVLWLSRDNVGANGLKFKTAGMLIACYAMPGRVFCALSGWISDKVDVRILIVMYWIFLACVWFAFVISSPLVNLVNCKVARIGGQIDFNLTTPLCLFVSLTMFLVFYGKVAVYKRIPIYYPNHIGSISAIVDFFGGALGSFLLPLKFQSVMNNLIRLWSSWFVLIAILLDDCKTDVMKFLTQQQKGYKK